MLRSFLALGHGVRRAGGDRGVRGAPRAAALGLVDRRQCFPPRGLDAFLRHQRVWDGDRLQDLRAERPRGADGREPLGLHAGRPLAGLGQECRRHRPAGVDLGSAARAPRDRFGARVRASMHHEARAGTDEGHDELVGNFVHDIGPRAGRPRRRRPQLEFVRVGLHCLRGRLAGRQHGVAQVPQATNSEVIPPFGVSGSNPFCTGG
mmetsp:Transcript_77211/g.236276  ORF Transcript_77211/g.236276 Transcript_77211/m.236276 type:complete len:206 (+) Transcript_77211:812-1429(+)